MAIETRDWGTATTNGGVGVGGMEQQTGGVSDLVRSTIDRQETRGEGGRGGEIRGCDCIDICGDKDGGYEGASQSMLSLSLSLSRSLSRLPTQPSLSSLLPSLQTSKYAMTSTSLSSLPLTSLHI